MGSFYVYLHLHSSEAGPVVFYVGKGTTLNNRKRYASKQGRSRFWHSVVGKHGFDSLIHTDGLTEEQAFSLEKELILSIGRRDLNAGPLVNFTNGGEGGVGFVHSAETLAKISATHLGKPKSSKTRAKMSAARMGKPKSSETRAKMSAAHLGKTKSPETRAKIGAARRGKKLGPYRTKRMLLAQLLSSLGV